ncbi:hypothetical protein BDZ89DRAFT_1050463 [Hymenopellis radicata]|nr:hypothetical protein BDZ89DRAFT_1050463 [Hymenopellis radicata]
MESLPDKGPPPSIGIASEPAIVPNGSASASEPTPPDASETTPPTRSTKKGGKGRRTSTKVLTEPATHHNRWTTPDQYKHLVDYRDKYLEFKAKQKLGLFWPDVENTFLARWPVSELCKQLSITEDDSVAQAHNAVSERNVRKPLTATGKIKKDASPEIREECTSAVEEEKKEKELLKALDEEDEGGERTPEQYASALAVLPAHISVFASKIAERTGQIFLITSVGPDERGSISSQSWQFGPSYARVNEAGHTFEEAYTGFKSFFLDQFKEYGKGCFTRTMRENHIADDRRRKISPVEPDAMLIDESTISAPVLTGLVETEDGLDIVGPDTNPLNEPSSSDVPMNSTWAPDGFILPTHTDPPASNVETSLPSSVISPPASMIPQTSSTSPPSSMSPSPASMIPPSSMIPSAAPESMIPPSSMIPSAAPESMIPPSSMIPSMIPQVSSTLQPSSTPINAASIPSGSFPSDFDWSLSTEEWDDLNNFMQGYDSTQNESLDLSSAPSKFTFSPFSQPSPHGPAPQPSIFSLPVGRPAPQASSDLSSAPSKFTFSAFSQPSPHGPAPKPSIFSLPMKMQSLVKSYGATTPPPELPPSRRREYEEGAREEAAEECTPKKAPVVAQTSAPAPPPSEPTPVPPPSESTRPPPKTARSRENKENVPPWCTELHCVCAAAMGDEWDLLVRSFEHLEGDMSREGTSTLLRPFKNVDTYGAEWRAWWNAIQPPCDVVWQSVLYRSEYKAEELATLRCGGENGLVSVLLGLFWWGTLLGTSKQYDAQMKLWSDAVHDFLQCVEVMQFGTGTSGGSAKKKARIS